ncbi:hypothetical protein TTHERM_000760235 (macronuclear) [Tetrahymena thermophila SB210]|uniref:Uncharacterized protein n=1 Tax=Tetrahymena thermophila (strain SB210) TaxID=312017 RepID=W7XD43_TETTS|nr:hypothetical protein TTHERM_000760235 [Tetrahymena thermophila SB210]EWS71736.1 hypothetical protein TTHERM_000760235 [Tetrahymena thermophila SB210]|eukprot:XP_012655722.1 hypothetical protein TTHERM_000760235 [Tetrahymena thermophila SB210]
MFWLDLRISVHCIMPIKTITYQMFLKADVLKIFGLLKKRLLILDKKGSK